MFHSYFERKNYKVLSLNLVHFPNFGNTVIAIQSEALKVGVISKDGYIMEASTHFHNGHITQQHAMKSKNFSIRYNYKNQVGSR